MGSLTRRSTILERLSFQMYPIIGYVKVFMKWLSIQSNYELAYVVHAVQEGQVPPLRLLQLLSSN